MVYKANTRFAAKLLICTLFSVSGLWPVTGQAQGFLKARGKEIVNGKGENIVLRGMGLGGWMLQEGYMLKVNEDGQQYRFKQRMEDLIGKEKTQGFYNLWLTNHTSKADVDSLKAWGFNSIRLPMHYNLYTLAVEQEPVPGKNTWLEKGFALTDSLLAWCKANKMYLILDLHATPGGQGNDLNISDRDPAKPSLWELEANRGKTIALWRKLAERYVNEPWIGGYDIINEPNWGFENLEKDRNGTQEKKNVPLRQLMVDITKAIRSVDKNHLIVVEGNGWGNNYNGILPPWDDNMVLSFHRYWTFNTSAAIASILKTRDQYNVPVWVGETGENSNVWFTDAISLLEKNNIGWAWWPLKKIGINNPMEVKSNGKYNAVLDYWNGKAVKPSAEDAYSGFMELAASVKAGKTVVHRDVIDAMIRQPFTTKTRPFKASRIAENGTVLAVGYDFGRNGYAYFDRDTADYHVSTGKSTPGNRGRAYRNDGVDISRNADGFVVSNIEDGEWLQYTVDVEKKGSYTLSLVTASNTSFGRVSVLINGTEVAKAAAVLNTGDFKSFKPLVINGVKLEKGKQIIRVFADVGGFNFQQILFKRER